MKTLFSALIFFSTLSSSAFAGEYKHFVYECSADGKGTSVHPTFMVDSIVSSTHEFLGWKVAIRDIKSTSLRKPTIELSVSFYSKYKDQLSPTSYVGYTSTQTVILSSPRITTELTKGFLGTLRIWDRQTGLSKSEYFVSCKKSLEYSGDFYGFKDTTYSKPL